MYRRYIKRLMDIVLSLAALIVLSPVMLVIALLVRIKLGSPVLFRQRRVGKDEKIFTMYKFRSMTDQKDAQGNLLPDEKRLTKFGKRLRSTSLDELPELFSILKGDLSIVGPRPLLEEYLPYYTEHERKRHVVRGGLTQPEVLKNLTFPTWDEQLALEADYADHISFLLDVKIIFLTFRTLFHRVDTDYGGRQRASLIKERELSPETKAVETITR